MGRGLMPSKTGPWGAQACTGGAVIETVLARVLGVAVLMNNLAVLKDMNNRQVP